MDAVIVFLESSFYYFEYFCLPKIKDLNDDRRGMDQSSGK
jgi:hypothetical protein